MLDIIATRRNFINWLRSPAFDGQFNAINKRATWPFWVGGILIVTLIGVLPGIAFLIYGWRRESARKAARRDVHLAFARHQPILCCLIIGNQTLFRTKGAMAPALLVGTFGDQDEDVLDDLESAAQLFAQLYGEDPAKVPAELREACAMVNDDSYKPDRRQPMPPHLFPERNFWLFDTVLLGDHFDSGSIDSPYIPCMATPGPQGTIAQMPPRVAVYRQIPKPAYNPNIIQHKTPETQPPLVAPISENIDAVVKHIAKHLGEPERVFHELISTTVHIDVHIVDATPDRPWVSLVTSGMSDIPMITPEGAEEFRFAELMMRLPADWDLGSGGLANEPNHWPIRTLKFLARFAHEHETWLGYGHSIPNGNPPEPISSDLPFAGMILSVPWIGGEEFAVLRLPDGAAVRIWSIIPLHPSEIAFKLTHGSEAFFDKLATAGYSDLFDPARPPVA
jgi:Suppressor of fused protein (SUFU)